MAELSETLNQLLSGQTEQISQRIGADNTSTASAVQAAVPSLLAALSQEADSGSGLHQALQQDHDGSIIDNLTGYLGGTAQLSPRTTDGAGILNHVLGDRQETLERGISAKSGLDIGSVGSLLTLLAPVVMGMLGKKQSSSGTGGSLGDLLNREKADAQSQGGLGDILGSILGGSNSSSGGLGNIAGSVSDMLSGKK
jgi:hypothetical protein